MRNFDAQALKLSQKSTPFFSISVYLWSPNFHAKPLFVLRTIDNTKPFRLIFSFYEHEFLRYLVSPYAIQLLADGTYGSDNQLVTPENLHHFKGQLSKEEVELVKLCGEIQPKAVIKKFGGDSMHAVTFFETRFNDKNKAVAETILAYIEKRMVQILPQLHGRACFEMKEDDVPHHRPVQVLEEKATAVFNFKRLPEHTLYYIAIKLHNKFIQLTHKKAHILTQQPAWILMNGQLFTFEDGIDGKKMQPFLTKFNIEVPKNREAEYYEKFVVGVLEKYEVKGEGFDIHHVITNPTFHFVIKPTDSQHISFEKWVEYADFRLPLDENENTTHCKVLFRNENGNFIFHKIHRNFAKEENLKRWLASVQPQPDSFLGWQSVPKNTALAWISLHLPLLEERGFVIHQPDTQIQYVLKTPELRINTQANGDWFDVQALVDIAGYQIPFVQFRNHILRHQREYALPNGSIIILPESWFQQYEKLAKLAEVKHGIYRFHRRDLPLIDDEEKPLHFDWKKEGNEVPQLAPPQQLKAQLRPYQQQGYEWLMYMNDNGRGAILADDMGLGKTIQALAMLLQEKEKGNHTPSLIVLPTSLIFNWSNEAKKFAPDLRLCVHTGPQRSKNAASFAFFDLVLTTYGVARIDVEMLREMEFHYVILDESQSIKNPESKVSQAVKRLKARFRLSITGTPVENSVMDIGSQLRFINPLLFERLFGNEANFQKQYVVPIEKGQDKQKLVELRKVVRHFILRRRKAQVATELPPKVEHLHLCEMTEKQQKMYEEVRDAYRTYLLNLINEGGFAKNKLNVLAGLQKIRQIAIHPLLTDEQTALEDSGKYEEVKRLLQEIIAEDSKVLIFSQFVKMLQVLKTDLQREKIKFAYLDGGTPPKAREQAVNTFQNDPDTKVFLISLKAGGSGLNLTAAEYVFILDPWWNPAVEEQAINRAHRIGQDKTVFYYKFISRQTIEEKIVELQRRKAQLAGSLIEEDEWLMQMNEEDVKWLVE